MNGGALLSSEPEPLLITEEEENELITKVEWPLVEKSPNAVRCQFFRDFLCSFSAPKRVSIGRRQGKVAACAGVLYWLLFTGLALGYFVLFQIVYCNNHLKYEAPMGSVTINLRRPTKFDPELNHRCSPLHPDCTNDFVDIRDHPYCMRSELGYEGEKKKCKFWDEDSVVGRALGEELLIVSRVKIWDQTRECDGTKEEETNCPKTFTSSHRDDFYISEIENFTVAIAHAMRTPTLIAEEDMKIRGSGLEVCTPRSVEDDEDEAAGHEVHTEHHSKESSRRLADSGKGNDVVDPTLAPDAATPVPPTHPPPPTPPSAKKGSAQA